MPSGSEVDPEWIDPEEGARTPTATIEWNAAATRTHVTKKTL